jgi:maleylpyruvate isomerase
VSALEWMREGTAVFDAAVADCDLDEPSALPGWTRRHVLSHVAYNARALTRLLHWARTGEETPMYASPEARDQEIEDGAKDPALRELYAATRDELAESIKITEAWDALVVTAQGRTVPASEIPWMRTREVWIHSVDLAVGVTFERFPDALVDALIDDVMELRRRRNQTPALVVAPGDRDRTWRSPSSDDPDARTLTGSAAELAAVLTGRASGPDLGRWL